MSADPLIERDHLVSDLRGAVHEGESGLNYVPRLLRKVLETEAWKERYDAKSRKTVSFDSFAEFVTTTPTEGLGASIELIRQVIAGDKKALDLFDQALQNRPGHPLSTGNIVPGRPEGNSEAKALRRLRKDAPELHAEVLEGRLSAHAAMVKAGFRPKTQTIRVNDPKSAARTLRKHMSPEARQALARLLMEED